MSTNWLLWSQNLQKVADVVFVEGLNWKNYPQIKFVRTDY